MMFRKNSLALLMVALMAISVTGCQTTSSGMRKLPDADKLQVRVHDVAKDEKVVDLLTRKGATQRILLLTPSSPAKAAVILFAGGSGNIDINTDGTIDVDSNFLVRSRNRFVKHGFVTAVFDVPSDQDTLRDHRDESWHVWDVASVVSYLKKQYGVPVWLVGTSRGTMTIGHVGSQLSKFIDGVAFTASMNEAADHPLENITVPAFVMHHTDDGCFVTTPDAAKDIAKGLVKSSKVELVFLKGGLDLGNPCQAQAHHGFKGIEDEAVGKLAKFIRENSKK